MYFPNQFGISGLLETLIKPAEAARSCFIFLKQVRVHISYFYMKPQKCFVDFYDSKEKVLQISNNGRINPEAYFAAVLFFIYLFFVESCAVM